jgi:outer membrane protein assembly factor BamB
MDVFDGQLLNENADGSVVLHKIGDKSATDQTTMLPLSPLGSSLGVYSSADGKLLALNTRTRAGVWDMSTGQRVLLAKHFNSAAFAPDDTVYIDFPKIGKQDRAIVHFEFAPFTVTPLAYKVDDTMKLRDGILQEWKTAAKDKQGVELIVHDVADESILWRRSFDAGEPAHAANVIPGSLLLSFPLKTDFAKARLKAGGPLADQATAIKDRDAGRLIQVLDNRTGNVLHELILAVPGEYEGVGGINIVGDLLYLTSADNRTMVYTLSTGTQLRQIFGYVVAADPASGHICTVNRRDEALVYDAKGQQLADFYMGSPLRFATFQHDGTHLVLLTADQKVRTMAVPAVPTTNLADGR